MAGMKANGIGGDPREVNGVVLIFVEVAWLEWRLCNNPALKPSDRMQMGWDQRDDLDSGSKRLDR